MLEHYTTFSKKLVSALAAKAGRMKTATKTGPAALIPPGMETAERLRSMIESMTHENINQVKRELLKAMDALSLPQMKE